MLDRPLVSVVVPFFNAAPFLAEAVSSVISQTYDHWEILLIDDGSGDASTEIALRYALQQEMTAMRKPRSWRWIAPPRRLFDMLNSS